MELMPTTFTSPAFWEEASLLNQRYYPMIFDNVEGTSDDMEVDVDAIIKVMDESLGQRDERGESVVEEYRWNAGELGLL